MADWNDFAGVYFFEITSLELAQRLTIVLLRYKGANHMSSLLLGASNFECNICGASLFNLANQEPADLSL